MVTIQCQTLSGPWRVPCARDAGSVHRAGLCTLVWWEQLVLPSFPSGPPPTSSQTPPSRITAWGPSGVLALDISPLLVCFLSH